MVNHLHDHLAGWTELHGIEGEIHIGTECLMEYSLEQAPVVATALESEVTFHPIPEVY
ncbi:hypothetical protein PAXRUDRAFT_826543 [Paxillus rubicundulus Ve08.2h10]|uniref:Uncharacterized protein n=1 Tax=Paxillus rubicundulus Ve08.2h10 TaxID=930991 RepID=A0A0D0DRX3_9AGAM|nr:hypothetical protein PAXRUDRAFT_826543 [Paxillus rubicundulus Ve08.2h10]